MATIRLVPSAYTRSSTSRVTVTNDTNMYYNTDHTSAYCSIRGRNSASYTYYCFIHGFNFDDVPSNAIVTGFRVLIRCYRNSYQATGSSYRMRLASQPSSSYVISNTTTSTDIDITADVIEIPTGNLEWDDLVDYGSNFSIDLVLRASSSQYPYIYVYGAEIEVTYTIPNPRTITSSINGTGTIDPSGSVTLYDGDNYTLTISGANSPTVTDNNVNVTSQLVRVTSGTSTFIPYDYDSSGFTISNIGNAYHDSSNTTYADLTLAGRTTGNLYLDLGGASIPSGATIQSVSCTATLQFSRNNSSSSVTSSFQLYSGSTAKGSANNWVTSATDISKNTYTLTTGSWTASEIENARFYITCYNGASSTQRHIYVYGVSFNVTYEVSGEVYTYTITNISGDHVIVVTSGASQPKMYVKINGTWTQFSKVYKKVNGSWVEQSTSTWSTLFNTSTNYRKMN